MNSLLKILVLSVSVSVALSMKDYCEIEKRLCGDQKHIGCDTNVFKDMESLYSLKLGTMTTELKEIILDNVNSFRRLVATGQKTQFPSASNMRLVNWDSELEYLASQMVLKLPNDDTACCKTDKHPDSLGFRQRGNGIYAPTVFIPFAIDVIFSYTLKQRTLSLLDFSFIYSANFTSLGCAFGTFKDKDDKMVLQCVRNEKEATTLANAYRQGSACENCSPNQICSLRYPGLCEDIKVLPVGPQGPAGPAGLPGTPGATGPKGDSGLNGTNGLPGKDGVDGIQGEKGEIGLPGIKGDRGVDGLVGDSGINGSGNNTESSNPISNIFSETKPYIWLLYVAAAIGTAVASFVGYKAMKSNGLIPWYS